MTIYLKYNTHLIGSNINVLDRFIVINWEIRTIKKKENPAQYYQMAIYIKFCVTIFFMLSNLLLNPSVPCLRRRTMKLSSNKWLQKVLYLRCGCKEIDPFLAVFVTDFFKSLALRNDCQYCFCIKLIFLSCLARVTLKNNTFVSTDFICTFNWIFYVAS